MSWTKNLNVPVETVLYDMSWQNLVLYSSATPQYNDEKDSKKEWDESLDANNPDNFADEPEFEYVRF